MTIFFGHVVQICHNNTQFFSSLFVKLQKQENIFFFIFITKNSNGKEFFFNCFNYIDNTIDFPFNLVSKVSMLSLSPLPFKNISSKQYRNVHTLNLHGIIEIYKKKIDLNISSFIYLTTHGSFPKRIMFRKIELF